jgi:inorganic pyrophosphatase
MRIFCFLLLSLSLTNCNSTKEIYTTPAFSESGALHCVIEIPGGTSKKIEFNSETKAFEIDQRNGADRIIPFLPYPANYGFIPSTVSDRSLGGDGDALDILLIAESIPTGTVVEAIPIAMLKLLDKGEYDYKVICVPSDPKKRIINATTYAQFVKKYSKAKDIIESWFLHYDTGGDTLTSEGWGDEKEALEEVTKSLKSH